MSLIYCLKACQGEREQVGGGGGQGKGGVEAGRREVRSLKVKEPFNGRRQRRDGER